MPGGGRVDAIALVQLRPTPYTIEKERYQRHPEPLRETREDCREALRVGGAVVRRHQHPEQENSATRLLGFRNDLTKIGLGHLERKSAEAVIAAETDDENVRSLPQHPPYSSQPTRGGVTTDTSVEDLHFMASLTKSALEQVRVSLLLRDPVASGQTVPEEGDPNRRRPDNRFVTLGRWECSSCRREQQQNEERLEPKTSAHGPQSTGGWRGQVVTCSRSRAASGEPQSLATKMPVPCLEVRKLTKVLSSGGRPLVVLDEVDLAIETSEFVVILGPSGSGKSTLLALMAGLDRPTRGEVLFNGREIQDRSENELALWRRHHVGFVFQAFQLLLHLTAKENVLLPLELKGEPGASQSADDLLDQVGLADRGHHYPSQLSGGEQQRVAVARAFAANPVLLLADEPTGNLDSKTGRAVLQMLSSLHQLHATTLVMVTHDPAAAQLADRLVYLSDGAVVREEKATTSPEPTPEAGTPGG